MRSFACLACRKVIKIVSFGHTDEADERDDIAGILHDHALTHAPDCEPDTEAVMAEFEEVSMRDCEGCGTDQAVTTYDIPALGDLGHDRRLCRPCAEGIGVITDPSESLMADEDVT